MVKPQGPEKAVPGMGLLVAVPAVEASSQTETQDKGEPVQCAMGARASHASVIGP